MLKHESLRRDKAEIRQRLVSNSQPKVEEQNFPVHEPTNRSNKIGEHHCPLSFLKAIMRKSSIFNGLLKLF